MITVKTADRKVKEKRKIRKLYNGSFPDDERIPFDILFTTMNEDRIMKAVYDEEKLIGMYYLFLHDDIVYLGYLCVDESERRKRYGTQILNQIAEEYEGSRIVVDIEEVKDEQQQKRKRFYLNSGYESTGVFYHIYGVDYELLSHGGIVTKDEWHRLIRKHWGRFAETAEYR